MSDQNLMARRVVFVASFGPPLTLLELLWDGTIVVSCSRHECQEASMSVEQSRELMLHLATIYTAPPPQLVVHKTAELEELLDRVNPRSLSRSMVVEDDLLSRSSDGDALVSPIFQGVHASKYETSPGELAAAQLWEAENTGPGSLERKPDRSVSSWAESRSLLGRLLSRDEDQGINPSVRDWLVASTVVQWLGTVAGRLFLSKLANAVKKKQVFVSRLKSRTGDDFYRCSHCSLEGPDGPDKLGGDVELEAPAMFAHLQEHILNKDAVEEWLLVHLAERIAG